jgi:hypothetical protein
MLLLTAKQIKKAAIDNGGLSVNYLGKQPTSGYMVAKRDSEYVVDKLTVAAIRKQQEKLIHSDCYLGIWLFEGKWYLDVSFNLQGYDSAIKIGRENHQIAIYDVAKNESIYL